MKLCVSALQINNLGCCAHQLCHVTMRRVSGLLCADTLHINKAVLVSAVNNQMKVAVRISVVI